ncbi:hypothetical protein [Cellulomonas citrea]|uniref:hypothetical protein n=1 Tax=Cellulomonas citrea TaxID=1909423 RepID=UPI001359D253|nr:hypothetical protein [Cellulomonas citrea]
MSAPDAVVRLESLAARGRTLGARVDDLVAQAEAAAPVPTPGLVHAEFDASGALSLLQFTVQASTATQEELEAAVNVAVVTGYRAQPEGAPDPRRSEALLRQVETHGLPEPRTVSSSDGRVRVDVVVGRVVAVGFAAGALGRRSLDEIGRTVVDTCARALTDDARGGR